MFFSHTAEAVRSRLTPGEAQGLLPVFDAGLTHTLRKSFPVLTNSNTLLNVDIQIIMLLTPLLSAEVKRKSKKSKKSKRIG